MNHRKVRDNGAEASIHFQKAEAIAFFHNSREAFIPETSNEELRAKNECDRTAEEARALFEELSSQGDENFLKNCGRRTNMKAENKLWESALNLRGRHTMADVQRVNARIQEITGFIPIQTAIHRDEGHVDEKTGDFIQNVHAQTTWLTQDPLTGKSLAYLLFDKKDVYRKIQDIVAEELGMTRGKPAEITGARHFKNMRDYKQMKRSEAKINKEWEQKLAEKEKAWQEKQKEWEQKQAEREARQAEWEKKIPEIVAARERNEKFLNDRVDWERVKQANKYFLLFNDISSDLRLYPNPNENFLTANAKNSLASVFRLFGSVTQLAAYLLTRHEAQDLKIQNALNVYKINENLQKCVNIVANDTSGDHEKITEKIRNVMSAIPQEKQLELIEYALLHAPTPELKADIQAIIDGDFEKIGKTALAQTRIDEKEMRRTLREVAEEARKIRDELREMEEENRVLNAAERAILKQKGANRSEYAEQEAQNKARQEEIQKLKDAQKALKKTIDDQKQSPDKDAETIKRQAAQIKELTSKIAQITAENAKKQKELEAAKDEAEKDKIELKDKIEELEAEKIIPQDIFDEINRVHYGIEPETLHDMAIDERDAALDERDEALKRVKELENELKQQPKIEQPNQPEPEPIKKDDNLNIYGYQTYTPEPRRRFGDYERKTYDRPRYVEPEPIREPEPREEPKDPWLEITDAMKKWTKCESEVEKSLLGGGLRLKLDEYEKNNSEINGERREMIRKYRVFLSYDPVAEAEEARKHAETLKKLADMNREREERKRQQAETEKKYEDVKQKNVRTEADARQTTIKKKKKDELEFGSI